MGPWSQFGPGPIWGPKFPWKNVFSLEIGFQSQVFEVSRGANGSLFVQDPSGRASFPTNLPTPQFGPNFLVFGGLGQGPWPVHWALFALCGPGQLRRPVAQTQAVVRTSDGQDMALALPCI